jgi:predicted nucleotidyltransferase
VLLSLSIHRHIDDLQGHKLEPHDTKIKSIADWAATGLDLRCVYVFGSILEKPTTKGRDLDVCVIFDGDPSDETLAELAGRVEISPWEQPLDLTWLAPSRLLLVHDPYRDPVLYRELLLPLALQGVCVQGEPLNEVELANPNDRVYRDVTLATVVDHIGRLPIDRNDNFLGLMPSFRDNGLPTIFPGRAPISLATWLATAELVLNDGTRISAKSELFLSNGPTTKTSHPDIVFRLDAVLRRRLDCRAPILHSDRHAVEQLCYSLALWVDEFSERIGVSSLDDPLN